MIDENELLYEELSSHTLFSWHRDIAHDVSSCSIIVNALQDLSPLSKLTRLDTAFRVARIKNIVIENSPFRREFGSGLPFALPPVAKLFTIVDIFLFGECSSTAPYDNEDNNVLDIAVFLL